MNCFAAGILLSLAFCQILPETQKEYARYLKKEGKEYMWFENFPFVYFLIITGIILTLCLDQVLFKPVWAVIRQDQK